MQILGKIYHSLGRTIYLKIILWFFVAGNALAQGQSLPSKETQVKGVFLYNFAMFTQWPAGEFPHPSAPLVIGILGDDPFGEFLDEIVEGETINGHPIAIQRYRSVNDVDTCHILFVEESDPIALQQVLTAVKGKNILTVGDAQDFTRQGGIVQFFIEDNKMRFEVNMKEYKQTNLVLSSRLLKLAQICCMENE